MSTPYYTPAQQSSLARIAPDIIRSRRLLGDLVSRSLRARYRNAAIGFAWAVLQPLAMTSILTVVFSFIVRGKPDEYGVVNSMRYPTFLLCGLIPWQFFSSAVSSAVNSLVENENLVKKVYFPREVIPIAAVLNCLVNFAIGFVVLVVAHAAFDGHLGLGAIGWLAIFVIEFVLTLGLALLLSCLNAAYHDVQYMTEVVLLFGFYATPIIVPLKTIGQGHQWIANILLLNPMTGLTIAYKQILFDNQLPEWGYLIWPAIAAAGVLIAGAVVFRRRAPTLADLL